MPTTQKLSTSQNAYFTGWLAAVIGLQSSDTSSFALAKSNPREFCVGVLHGKKSMTPIMADDVLTRVIEDLTNAQERMRGEL